MKRGIEGGRLRLLLSAGAALAITLTGCTSTGSLNSRGETSLRMLPKAVSFYPQEDYQCGPSALASVMNYWGFVVTPEEIAREIYSRSARGTLTIDMLFYAEGKGLEASQYFGSPEDIRVKIESGQPLIVLVDAGFSVIRSSHFMVIVGYSDNGVIVNSGRREGLFVSYDEFLPSWDKTRRWTLLLKPGKAL